MLLIWIDRFGRFWPLLAAVAAAFMLAVAHAFETFGGYPPCELCLQQRDIYWVDRMLAGALLFIAALVRPSGCCARICLAAGHPVHDWRKPQWPPITPAWSGSGGRGRPACTGAGVHALSVADMSGLLLRQDRSTSSGAMWRRGAFSASRWRAGTPWRP